VPTPHRAGGFPIGDRKEPVPKPRGIEFELIADPLERAGISVV